MAELHPPWCDATPCTGRHEWVSEVPEERQEAARLCAGCPAWAACAAAGRDEPWGVWAGVDRAGPEAVAQRRLRGLRGAAA